MRKVAGVSVSAGYIVIPAMLRFWFGKTLNLAAGGYYGIGIGTDADFTAVGAKKTDYGLMAALGVHLKAGRTAGIFLEARGHYGLAKQISDQTWNEIMGVVGLRFGEMRGR